MVAPMETPSAISSRNVYRPKQPVEKPSHYSTGWFFVCFFFRIGAVGKIFLAADSLQDMVNGPR
jgi:hypothetical protein